MAEEPGGGPQGVHPHERNLGLVAAWLPCLDFLLFRFSLQEWQGPTREHGPKFARWRRILLLFVSYCFIPIQAPTRTSRECSFTGSTDARARANWMLLICKSFPFWIAIAISLRARFRKVIAQTADEVPGVMVQMADGVLGGYGADGW